MGFFVTPSSPAYGLTLIHSHFIAFFFLSLYINLHSHFSPLLVPPAQQDPASPVTRYPHNTNQADSTTSSSNNQAPVLTLLCTRLNLSSYNVYSQTTLPQSLTFRHTVDHSCRLLPPRMISSTHVMTASCLPPSRALLINENNLIRQK